MPAVGLLGFLDGTSHVFLANLAQVFRFGFGALRFLFTLFPFNTYSS